MVTGEPIPVERRAGDPVTGGTVNQAGAFTMRAQSITPVPAAIGEHVRRCPTAEGEQVRGRLLHTVNG